jgi:hypothetical protein
MCQRDNSKKPPKATNTCLLEYFIEIQEEISISFCEIVKAFQFPEGLIYIDMINNIRVI